MTTQVITPAEAWEEVERLKAWVIFNRQDGKWYADVPTEMFYFGCGDTPLEAVTHMLSRIAEVAKKAEAANV